VSDSFLLYKDDFSEAKKRMEAWWQGEVLDRIPIKITAPKKEIKGLDSWIMSGAFPLSRPDYRLVNLEEEHVEDLESYFTDPDLVIPRLEKLIEDTYWGGEAFPVMFPVSIGMVAILGAYLGAKINYVDTVDTWVGPPIIKDWKSRKSFGFDPQNGLWKKSKILLEEASKRGFGKYIVGIPDLNGPGEILAELRGHEKFCIDLIENSDYVPEAMKEINYAWLRYWQASHGIIHQYMGGYTNFLAVWSELPATDLQVDFSCLISPQDFKKFFIPYIEEQTEWIDKTIYHLDGPDAVRHLDSLLALPNLNGIQWVPGAGSPYMSDWIPLLQKIQTAGKLLYICCQKHEVKTIIKQLKPEGIIFDTSCGSVKEAEELLKNVKKWS
jgi:hypothetical protein